MEKKSSKEQACDRKQEACDALLDLYVESNQGYLVAITRELKGLGLSTSAVARILRLPDNIVKDCTRFRKENGQ